MKKKKSPKKTKVVKTRNAGTMTESAFWGFIRASLRNRSRFWKPILETKKNARRAYKGENKRQKWEYQCNICKNWFMDKETSVDHIQPVGTLRGAQDLPEFVENLFCESNNLQLICSSCHHLKTQKERNDLSGKNNK